MKKISALILFVLVVTALPLGIVSAEDAPIKIGVLQLVEHAALDAAYQGFVDALKEAGFEDGVNIEIDYQNAQADQSNLMTISERFVKNNVDLILAIATPAAQAVASATTTIPILFTAVTDPVAARLVESNEKPGLNVTGTTDAGPIDKQFALMKELFPDLKTIGIIYNSSEVNSEVQAKQAEEIAKEMGWEVKFGTITSVNDIEQVANSLAEKVDGFYAPTDNTIASAMPNLVKVAEEKKLPILGSEPGMVEGGALMTVGIDYFKLGQQTGKMAVKILKGEAVPAEMPVESLKDVDIVLNQATAKAIGFEFPESVLKKATKVIGE
ncbi:MAG TPA: ABC transporter substrate-binding protein [Flexilinea sp.]|jgi:putative ABC transport system substrate-binding protein|nr:ABC transporter substrate-binding protein [Flexilinea sp.]OQA28356.1 MAG: ABC transporter substrate binding protein [Chloroflexi bacterium ADurb.Bin344]HNY93211.1 ABC transporter substrate-binding protein [Flexilinea sp.]HOG22494.1 ABC transporter substrate-binding protein [Flexilinea sp.]HOG59792.1 ABC transporter substrate-binding protein [Flexilinea sp.]